MLPTFLRIILFLLHSAHSQEHTRTPQKLHQIVASPGADIQINCSIPSGEVVNKEWGTLWYKEQQGRSLHKIYLSSRFSTLEGKYSGLVPNLTISNVQRNDSGVYYCTNYGTLKSRLFSGARLIVTDTPKPSRSVLVPFPLEGTQPNHSIPCLCLTLDANPNWDNFSWDISEESSQDQKGVGVMDKDGTFSVWHLEMIPLEEWMEEKITVDKGTCIYSLYIGIPSILIILVPLLILLFRKHRARGNSDQAEQAEYQMPMREIPQTNYTEVHYKSRNVRCVD